jgi:hypothetical protein
MVEPYVSFNVVKRKKLKEIVEMMASIYVMKKNIIELSILFTFKTSSSWWKRE